MALGEPGGGRGVPRGAAGDVRAPSTGSCGPGWRGRRASPATSTPPAAALDGLELEGDAADGPILLARGNLAYFTGDVDTAWEVAGQARALLPLAEDPWHIIDLVSLQGLIAHQRGEWFDRFRIELRRTQGKERWPSRSSTPTCASPSTCSTGRCPTPR